MILKFLLALILGYGSRGLKGPIDTIFDSERSSYLVRVGVGMLTVLSMMQVFWDRLDRDARREATIGAVLSAVFVGGGVVVGDMIQSWRELRK